MIYRHSAGGSARNAQTHSGSAAPRQKPADSVPPALFDHRLQTNESVFRICLTSTYACTLNADQLEHEKLTPRSYTDEGTPVCTLHGYTSVVLTKHTHSLLDADLCRSLCVIYILIDIYTSRVCVLSSLRSQEQIN